MLMCKKMVASTMISSFGFRQLKQHCLVPRWGFSPPMWPGYEQAHIGGDYFPKAARWGFSPPMWPGYEQAHQGGGYFPKAPR